MSRKEPTTVFDTDGALEETLHQVAHRSEEGGEDAEEDSDEVGTLIRNDIEPSASRQNTGSHEAEDHTTDEAFPTLLGTDMGRHFVVTLGSLGRHGSYTVRTRIVHPDEDEQGEQ